MRNMLAMAALLGAAAASPMWDGKSALPANTAGGKNWVLLVAGSNTYDNYRHQSDVCHAYRLVSEKGGIPKEQIVTFMFNDVWPATSNRCAACPACLHFRCRA